MRLLILGGTVFLGRHLVEAALGRGHELTLFNRGQHNPDLFPEVEKIRGDRAEDLGALEGRSWDAVVDTCGYVPRVVGAAARLLAGVVEHYTFVSSVSVYVDPGAGCDETAPLGRLEDESVEEITGETYGPLKALCERAADEAMPGRVLNVRPGLIVGPWDPSDRFTYWPHRVARGGEVLAPGEPEAQVQVIDVRDLGAWMLDCIERRTTGAFNAVGPAEPLAMERLLEVCRQVTASDARFTWADEAFLLEQDVGPFVELPLWVPREMEGMLGVSVRKALEAGLGLRPLDETIRDTVAWAATRPGDHEWRAGLTPERERKLLEAWKRRQAGS